MLYRKLLVCVSVIMLLCFLSILNVYAATATFNVDLSNVIKPYDKRILGSGIEWSMGAPSYMQRQDSIELNGNYIDFMRKSKVPITSYRIGGMSSRRFHFKDSVGKLADRATRYNFGLAEFIKIYQNINPEVEFIICLNIEFDTPEDNADLVRFLMLMPDDPDAIGSDGINWAQKRVDSGISAPVTNVIFELGNEVDWANSVEASATAMTAYEYVTVCKEIMSEMRSVVSDLEFSVQCVTQYSTTGLDSSSQNPTASIWSYHVLSNLCVASSGFEPANYASKHVYYGGHSISGIFSIRVNDITDILESLGIEDRVKLLITEHSQWRYDSSIESRIATSALHGTLWTAAFLSECINSPYIEVADYFTLMGTSEKSTFVPDTPWRMVNDYRNGQYVLSGVGELYSLLNEYLGGDVVDSSVDFVNTTEYDNELFGFATKKGDDLVVVLSNINDSSYYADNNGNAHNVNLSFENNTNALYLKKKVQLTANELMSYNTLNHPNSFKKTETVYTTQEEITQVSLPAYSVTVLIFGDELKTELISDVSLTNQVNTSNGKLVKNNNGKVEGSVAFKKGYQWSECSAIVLNKGVSEKDYQLSDIIAINQFIGQYPNSDFEIYMPKASPNGEYTLLVTASGINGTQSFAKKFYFNSDMVNATPILNMSINNPTVNADIPTIDNRDIQIIVELKDEALIGRAFSLLVVEGNKQFEELTNDDIIHFSQLSYAQDGELLYSFRMPYDASSQYYTAFVSYQPYYGEEVITERLVFIYQNLNIAFPLRILNGPKNEEGETITASNITSSNSINLEVENITQTIYNANLFVGCYDMGGILLKNLVFKPKTFELGTNSLSCSINIDDNIEISFAKIFIWEGFSNENIKPLTEFFLIV